MAQLDAGVSIAEDNQDSIGRVLEMVVETRRELVAGMDAIAAAQQAMLEVQREHTALKGQIVETLAMFGRPKEES